MKRITKKVAIVEGCDTIWLNAHDAQKMIQALKEDISELQNNADFERLEEILDEVLMISNHLYYIAGKDELQLKDDEETAEEKEETEE